MSERLQNIFFGLCCLLYLIVLLYKLPDYPIYFFCDEAFQTVKGLEILSNGFKSNSGEILPIYFEAAPGRWTPDITVYFQGISALLFGTSIFVTRATTVCFGFLGVLSLSLTLKRFAKLSIWWMTPLALASIPIWFLHTRTGFETAIMASFLAMFQYFYLRYRCDGSWHILTASLCASIAFYSYSNGQVIVATLILVLGLVDLPYHFRNFKKLVCALLLGGLLTFPAVQIYYFQHN